MNFSILFTFVAIIIAVVNAAPIVTTKTDLTGQSFESSCGDQGGVFISGVFHQGFRTECTTPNPDGTFSCRLDSQFNISNGRVNINGVIWNIVEASHTTNILTIGPGEFGTIQRSILMAQAIQPGTGVVRKVFGNLKCEVDNGIRDCKVNKFIVDC